MIIEYEIQGVTTYLPSAITEAGIEAAKKASEYSLRATGVFSDIKHEVVKNDEDVFMQLHSSGKRFIKEVESA